MRTSIHRTVLVPVGLALLLCALAPPGEARAWGRDGHRIVCEIAWLEMSAETRDAIRSLLSPERGMPRFHEACVWPDLPEVRDGARYRDDRERHYVNVPPGAAGFVRERDCPGRCVVEGIERYSRRLADRELDAAARLEALAFLGHLVGDVHQPLHVGYARDRGGNEFRIRLRGLEADRGGRPYNLHRLWDVEVIEALARPWPELARELQGEIEADERPPDDDPVVWANESFRLVEERVYRGLRPGADIRDAYLEAQGRLVRGRLELAGLRLAARLDAILGSGR